MKRIITAVICGILFATSVHQARANVYASGVSIAPTAGNFSIKFNLNEDATGGVNIRVIDVATSTVVRTIVAGNLLKGPQSVLWDSTNDSSAVVPDGPYVFEIEASATGHANLTAINDATLNTWKFYSPRGVAVNQDPTSPNFGQVYVTDTGGATTAHTVNRTTVGSGVFVLSADQRDVTNQGDNAHGGVFDEVSSSSPYRLALDAEENLFIADWSDANSGVYIVSENNIGVFDTLFSTASRDGAGLLTVGGVEVCGSVGFAHIAGEGASKMMYTIDEDTSLGAAIAPLSMSSYVIGSAISGYETPPTLEWENTDGLVVSSGGQLISDGADGFFFAQYRWSDTATAPSLIHIANDGTVDFNSGVVFDDVALLGPSYGGGVALSADGDTILLSGYGFLSIIDISGGDLSALTAANVTTYDAAAGYSGNSTRSVAFDAAGNMYATNSSAEMLHIVSPAGANSYTTPSPDGAVMDVGAYSAVDNWLHFN